MDELINNVEETEVFLLREPVFTVDYVSYLDYIEGATARVDKMEAELDYCKELYDITEEFAIPVAQEEMATYLGLSVSLGNLRNLVDKKLEDVGRITKAFNGQMSKDISCLISEVGVIKDECMVRSQTVFYNFILTSFVSKLGYTTSVRISTKWQISWVICTIVWSVARNERPNSKAIRNNFG